jgi:hypothetical protein
MGAKKKPNHYEMFSRYFQRLLKPEACQITAGG